MPGFLRPRPALPRPRVAALRAAALRAARAVAVLAVAVTGAAGLAGCAPGLSPLTRDYRLPASDSLAAQSGVATRADSLALARAARALRAAGWTLAPRLGGAITTEPRAGAGWGLYDMRLRLDVVPLADGHLRIVFDPYRRYVWRSRTHVPYLPGGLVRRFAAPLDDALEAAGLEAVTVGAPRDLGRRRATRVGG